MRADNVTVAVPMQLGHLQPWMSGARVKTYRRGQTIIEAGSQHDEWVAISSGAACLLAKAASDTSVAVAALWLGDVIGWNSPLGRLSARYDVNALVDVVTINVPKTQVAAPQGGQFLQHTALLHAATEDRLQSQISKRLAGNGFQRLVSVLAMLAAALAPPAERRRLGTGVPLPVSQACIGQLSGLSRRQTWIYLGQLASAGWVTTSRTKVVLQGLRAWLDLMDEVERKGMSCIDSVAACSATMTGLLCRP